MFAQFFPTSESILPRQYELNLVQANRMVDREVEPHGFNRWQLALEEMLQQVFGLFAELFESRVIWQFLQREWFLGNLRDSLEELTGSCGLHASIWRRST